MTSDHFRDRIADRVKQSRTEQGLSLDAAARATGVSKAMLGQIERRESAPTIATLWKIATGLNISFSSFFAAEAGPPPDRADMQPPLTDDPDMRMRVLFPFDPATAMEMFEVTLSRHHHQISLPHRHGVVEHVVVLSGTLDLGFEGRWHTLHPGEALRFHADVRHEYRAVTESAVFQNIICYT